MTTEGGGASQTTDPAAGTSTATDVSLREHLLALRAADLRLDAERDRRYSEVQIERDKAEVLRAANQAYKDEKANELREQISRERGEYVTQAELKGVVAEIKATLGPVLEFVASQQGNRQGQLDARQIAQFVIGLILAGLTVYFAFN